MNHSDVKLVKVDNWGIYFLQRLKHFFNRTDYCDLTLQFQDNAQLKVHRLVINACTEYFELLERTCEMYEDCLVMPDDLQADVVVPIVNFMYTGQLEFKLDSLERLYQTSQIMNMPVLTKLLEAHRDQTFVQPALQSLQTRKPAVTYNPIKRSYSKPKEGHSKTKQVTNTTSSNSQNKRSYTSAFSNISSITSNQKENKKFVVSQKRAVSPNNGIGQIFSPKNLNPAPAFRKVTLGDPRPTRYELPEELDADNIFENSFSTISYTTQPLMVHPDTPKHYPSRKTRLFGETSGMRKLESGTSTLDIVECKKVSNNDNIFDDDAGIDDTAIFKVKDTTPKVSNQLFDQIIDQQEGPKVTIETKDSKQGTNLDHAKIISEVLKKYPHLVKSNKNIKLKILNTPTNNTPKNKPKPKRQKNSNMSFVSEPEVKVKTEIPDFTYETDVLDSKEAARLIALGAENTNGPWICLICGTPGKALHFTSYYKFRRHLVEAHNEKPICNMCEYCGLKSPKRNYLLHHLLTKHGIEPPPTYHFPKCNSCNYVALTETFLARHKLIHNERKSFRCNVCPAWFGSSSQLLAHIRATGHKYVDKKTNLQCIYCQKVFLREGNLYTHLKSLHKQAAKADGIIDDSEDELEIEREEPNPPKYEPRKYENIKTEFVDEETQYQIRPDGNIEVITKKINQPKSKKQKILNSGFDTSEPGKKSKPVQSVANTQDDFTEEIVMIDNNEYIVRDNQLILKKKTNYQYDIPAMISTETDQSLTPSTSIDFSSINEENLQGQKLVAKKTNINQPIQIVVSNEEQYKALMNSNHSIIFDDGDANKTLTVLSAPDNTTLNTTTLDLDSTQSNDMMIINDNYSLNVSEALPSNNSNIVVVYSHPVDEQNKQYEIITSQDIGAEFVQSSAVITQNFETLTTSAPVMNAHVMTSMDTQVSESWHNNIQQNQITIVEQTEIISDETRRNITLDDLPEVTLTREKSQEAIVQRNQTDSHLNQSNDSLNTNPTEESLNVCSTPMDVDVPTTVIPDNSSTVDRSDDNINAIVAPNSQSKCVSEVSSNPQDQDIITEQQQLIEEPSVEEQDTCETEEQGTCETEEQGTCETEEQGTCETEEQGTCETEEQGTCETEQGTCEIEEQGTCKTEEQGTCETQEQGTCEIEEQGTCETEEQGTCETEELNTCETEEQSTCETVDTLEKTEEHENLQLTEIEMTAKKVLSNTASIDETHVNNEVPLTEVAKEKIQSLASEWSEDECESVDQEQVSEEIEETNQKDVPTVEESEESQEMDVSQEIDVSQEVNVSQEMEESIENIQQEMDKQLNEVTDRSQEKVDVDASQEKISSLLNDWDENDSQEGNNVIASTKDPEALQSIASADDMAELKVPERDADKLEPKKDDKIKSLVSDWDDD